MTPGSLDDVDDFPNRTGFGNFTWSQSAVADWEDIWSMLWHLGIKWQWQNIDSYARPQGDSYTVFTVHHDAYRLDMAIPLPEIHAINEIAAWLLDAPIDDYRVTQAQQLIKKWKNNYVRQT